MICSECMERMIINTFLLVSNKIITINKEYFLKLAFPVI